MEINTSIVEHQFKFILQSHLIKVTESQAKLQRFKSKKTCQDVVTSNGNSPRNKGGTKELNTANERA